MEKLTGRSVRNLSLGDIQIAKDYAMDQMGVNELPPIDPEKHNIELSYLPTKTQKIIQSVIPFRKALVVAKVNTCKNLYDTCFTNVYLGHHLWKTLNACWRKKYANACDAETIKHIFSFLNISEKYIIEAVVCRFVGDKKLPFYCFPSCRCYQIQTVCR